MKKLLVLGVSVLSAGVLAVSVAAPVLAWHPKGQIKKSVQNVTQNGTLTDANSANDAVQVKTGDTLKYVVEVKNVAPAASKEYNDMHFTTLRDKLPEGIELVSDPSKREIVENLGVLKPGQSVTKTYEVRVTSDEKDAVITNKACFTGDSKVKDNKQSGCDDAVVKVFVPQTTSTNTEEPTPQVKGVTTLPATGPAGIAAITTAVSGLGFIGHELVSRKRQ